MTAAPHIPPVVSIANVSKTYASGLRALDRIDLAIRRGEIFALLGPNGAGKTTLINIVCGIVTPSTGTILANGHDVVRDYRAARREIGLVPQEIATHTWETPLHTVRFSRGLFGKPANAAFIEKILRDLSLYDKRNDPIMTLSGGMKRRVMIAKALAHEPSILFLDEPTAGVDVELRRDMWTLVRSLRERGVTIILTTHYIDEAEEMADRIGIIHKGQLIVTEEKNRLLRTLGRKELTLHLAHRIAAVPPELAPWRLELEADGHELRYSFQAEDEHTGIPELLKRLGELGIAFRDLHTRQSSLEEIFVGLVSERAKVAS
jgi:ABC-2 type transport system ATP-binding protein